MKNLSQGQTLIETIVAFTVSVTIISAVVIATLYALSNAQVSKNQNLATQYAQEAVENIRQRNLSGVSITGGAQCLNSNMQLSNKGNADCPVMSTTIPFLRQVTIQNGDKCGNNVRQVTVSVFWSDNKCTSSNLYCQKVEVVSCFSDVNRVLGP